MILAKILTCIPGKEQTILIGLGLLHGTITSHKTDKAMHSLFSRQNSEKSHCFFVSVVFPETQNAVY